MLHEEFQKENPRVERMTRHLYDLERLMDTDFGKAALADPKMYVEIVRHRSIFNTIRGVDYRTHHPSRIDFIPPEKLAEVWRRDYERMQEYFIYGDSLPYDRLIARMAELRDRFRKVVMEDDFSANRNYESRVLFPERSSSDRGKRRDFCFDRFVQRHGFAGISALAGACFACPRRTWRDRILLFQRGQFGGSFGAFFRRFGCSQPRGEEKTTTEGVGSEQRCERSPDAIVPESAVVSADPVPDDRILENALATVYEYTDKDLGDAVDGTNRQILRRRLLYLACMAPVRMMCRRFGFGMIG